MVTPCPGPMTWHDAPAPGALLKCAYCGYRVAAGSFFDARHTQTPFTDDDAELPREEPSRDEDDHRGFTR